MRFELIKWSFDLPLQASTTKLVLVLMASHCNPVRPDDPGTSCSAPGLSSVPVWKLLEMGYVFCCWPSIPYIAAKTGMNKKTVIKALSQLLNYGYVSDTGERCGSRHNTKIYQLNVTKIHQDGELTSTKNGTCSGSTGTKNGTGSGADSPEKLSTTGTNIGTRQQVPKTVPDAVTGTKNGTGSEATGTKNGTPDRYQKRYRYYLILDYINNNLQLNLNTWRLWITYLFEQHQQELDADPVAMADKLVAFGDHDQQHNVVVNAIDRGWRQLHPPLRDAKSIKQSAGLP